MQTVPRWSNATSLVDPAAGLFKAPGSDAKRVDRLDLPWLTLSLTFCCVDALVVFAAGWFARLPLSAGSVGFADAGMLAVATALAVGMFYRMHFYSRVAMLQAMPLLRVATGWIQALGLWLLASTALAAFVPVVFDWMWPDPALSGYARAWLLAFAGLGLAGLLGCRMLWNVLRRVIFDGTLVHGRAVLVGSGETARQTLAYLQAHGAANVEIVGAIDPSPSGGADIPHNLASLGGVADLAPIIQRHAISFVIVALPWTEAAQMAGIIRHASQFPVDIFVMPDSDIRPFFDRPPTTLAGCPMLSVRKSPISGPGAVIKRIEDVFIAVFLLVVLAPFLALLALAIRLDSRGPALFRQSRFGFNNQVIEVFKFRSMYHDMADAGAAQQTTVGDPRVTRVGAFIRRHSLDELPQLFNVLRGDMSIVGPRPHAVATRTEGKLLEDALESYIGRLQVKPGITGLAQVNGWRGQLDTRMKLMRRVELDVEYIESWSLLLDLRIILRTVSCLVQDGDAY